EPAHRAGSARSRGGSMICPDCSTRHTPDTWDALTFLCIELTAGAAVELRRCRCGTVCRVEMFGPGDWLLCIERRARAAREALRGGMTQVVASDIQQLRELVWAADRHLAKAREREVYRKSA